MSNQNKRNKQANKNSRALVSPMLGRQSVQFAQAPYIISSASIAGKKEGEGPLRKMFDMVSQDNLFGENTWEEAESTMQKEACILALGKAHVSEEEVRFLFGGDLLRQGIATSLGVEKLNIPLFGLFGACSTSGEALALAAMTVAAGYGDYVMAVTSSHFGSAEKEFRFPLGYANQRPLSAQWTVTASGAFLVGKAKSIAGKTMDGVEQMMDAEEEAENRAGEMSNAEGEAKSVAVENKGAVRITGVTIGKIVDYGLKDSQNMGACMAPAACDTILRHMKDFGRTPDDYNRIITGDLGYIGHSVLLDLMREQGYDLEQKHLDCGMLIFDQESQDTHAGGSGCGCAASTLASYILPKLESGEWKRILFVPTGALMSTVSFNEGASVPGIAHAIVLEHEDESME
jgi:stage V sporulation protein AD